MPELPEVETVARQLAPLVSGRRIRAFEILDRERLRVPRGPQLVGKTLYGVERAGKYVVLRIGEARRRESAVPLNLAVHLRMTGRLLWRAGRPAPSDHLRARLVLVGGVLEFCDVRRFGTLQLVADTRTLLAGGVDPLRELDASRLAALLHGSRQALKTWLLRQDRLVGIGNIYASEILYHAGLHPLRIGARLTGAERERLFRAIRAVLEAAVAACGTTFSDFQDAHGLSGGYQRFLAVYGREGQRCSRCRRLIRRITQQQRSTFFCPGCQRRRLAPHSRP